MTPSPYGQRAALAPDDQLRRRVDDLASSSTSRLLPMPGTPTRVTSCARAPPSHARGRRAAAPARARARRAPRRLDDVDAERERASTASHTGIGSALPFAWTGSAGRYSIAPLRRAMGRSPTRMPLTGAAACSRAAVLTTSPAAMPSPSLGPGAERDERLAGGDGDAHLSSGCSSTTQSRIASAARTARSGSSSCATGAPKTAITASPMNFSTVPPWRSSSARSRA